MRKANIAKILGIAAAIPMLTLATTSSAYASTGYDISWKQNATGHCLDWQAHDGGGYTVTADFWCLNNAPSDSVSWDDIQEGLENQTGPFYKETPHGFDNVCLTAFWAPADGSTDVGPVYMENCSSPANYYEQWNEVSVGNGFQLINRETGACLDADGNGNVYTRPCAQNPQDNQYQIWH